MITYRLNKDATYVVKIVDDVPTGIWCNVESHKEYLEWVAEGNTPDPAEDTNTWEHVRLKRDALIRESDWTMIPGCTVDQAQWAAYRQTLRDIPATYAETGPESVVWPRKPSTSGPNTIDE